MTSNSVSLPQISVSEPDKTAISAVAVVNPDLDFQPSLETKKGLRRPSMSHATSSSLSKRTSNAPRLSQMPPRVFEVSEQGSVRLSPSVVHARPTAALMNLPLPSLRIDPYIRRNEQAAASVSRLGDMPAFTADGVHDRDVDSDHDSTGDDDTSSPSPHIRRRRRQTQLDTDSDDDEEDHDGTTSSFAPHRETTNFSFFDHPHETKRSQSFWHNTSPLIPALKVGSFSPHVETPGSLLGDDRPTVFRLKSQSMIDVTLSPKAKEKMPAIANPIPEVETPGEEMNTVKKRRSMPTFNQTTDPPPYPEFNFTKPQNYALHHDETINEHLPLYSNHIHVVAVMPRKMEFSAPGVQARDRKWRRTLCELEGTVFRIYNCPAEVAGKSALSNWWERKVGVGDVSNFAGNQATAVSSVPKNTVKPSQQTPMKFKDEYSNPEASTVAASEQTNDEPRRSTSRVDMSTSSTPAKPRRFTSHFLHPSRTSLSASPASGSTSHIRSRSETHPQQQLQQPRRSFEFRAQPRASTSESSSAAEHTSSASPTTLSTSPLSSPRSISPTSSSVSKADTYSAPRPIRPDKSDLIRTYTLQHAESGLGNDYAKRKNVIRVRMEGEQFLLQAPDVPAVVEWIEGLHAATDVSLDLDERPMPRGPIFPRRRRRRPRVATTDGGIVRDLAAVARTVR